MTSLSHDIADLQTRRLVILESPCAPSATSTWDEHVEYLAEALQHSAVQQQEAPIASHGLFAFSHALDDNLVSERRAGMLAGWAWMRVAQAIIVYADLGISPGMARGIDIAAQLGVPTFYRYIRAGSGPLGTFTAPHPPQEKQPRDE